MTTGAETVTVAAATAVSIADVKLPSRVAIAGRAMAAFTSTRIVAAVMALAPPGAAATNAVLAAVTWATAVAPFAEN